MLAAIETKLFKRTFWVITAGANSNLTIIRSGFGRLNILIADMAAEVLVRPNSVIQNAVLAYQNQNFEPITNFELVQPGSEFASRVWREISAIPVGETISYGAGSPAAVRAVGTACGKNRIPIFIPCHRVIPTTGGVGKYAYGIKLKEQLLEHELGKHRIPKSALRK
jgi:methylated-DNA-[protein]-cysteine S-methyltransferase